MAKERIAQIKAKLTLPYLPKAREIRDDMRLLLDQVEGLQKDLAFSGMERDEHYDEIVRLREALEWVAAHECQCTPPGPGANGVPELGIKCASCTAKETLGQCGPPGADENSPRANAKKSRPRRGK